MKVPSHETVTEALATDAWCVLIEPTLDLDDILLR